jgi:hypothetical protein
MCPEYGGPMSRNEPTPTNALVGAGAAVDPADLRINLRVALIRMATTWAVQQGIEVGYQRITGRVLPSALDSDVPLRRILRWAAVSAAAVAVSNVAVDRLVLRPNEIDPNGEPA